MVTFATPAPGSGKLLAERLNLGLEKREGHDLVGHCIACNSSDAFRLHIDCGKAYCFSCGVGWSPRRVAEVKLADTLTAGSLVAELGLEGVPVGSVDSFSATGQPANSFRAVIETLARNKSVSADALIAYGAVTKTPRMVAFPVYGPDGEQCSHFFIWTTGNDKELKGKFEAKKKAGLFFPHVDGKVRLPQAGETWYIVEGAIVKSCG